MKRAVRPINRLGGLALLVRRGQSDTFSPPVDDDTRTRGSAEYFLAIDALVAGKATPGHFRTLATMINMCNVLAIRGYGKEHADLIWDAFDALHRIQQRRIKLNKFGLDGDGVNALRAIAPLIEAQAAVVNEADMIAAHDEMTNLLASGKTYKP